RPLSRRPPEPAEPEPTQPEVEAKAVRAGRLPAVRPRKPPPEPARPRPGTTLDGSWDRKLESGAVRPDRVLDLHGHDLDRAWSAIDSALERAIDAGDRVLLLITGHARPGDPPVQRGRIRAAVHDWLAVSRHAARIAAVRPAHGRHGGGGSLYIILRRR
ncbi:MAG TPA: Smr/MutS family protein, partial [Sphingomicrobium sp.]|nr:Smr/MutS family protein [Sphingomicrobium sp.]